MNKDSDADFGNMSRTSAHDFWLLVGLTLVLAVPAGIILFDIRSPRPVVPVESNASPLGYTWSLLLFIVPDMYLGWKVWRLQRSESEKKAFGHALMWLCFVAFFMDMAFGMTFLTFPYPKATLQIFLPGYDPASLPGHKWQWCIPIEEFLFYTLGFVAILSIYVWADKEWLRGKAVQTAAQPVKQKSKLRARSLIVALLVGGFLFMISLFIKHHASGRWHDGWPAYFCFLLAVSIVPTVFCFNIAARRINWRAFTLAYLFITLISQFWESSLGVPYQWWGYQPEAMMGIRFPAYCGMPIEASLVWVASAWTSIIIYETLVEWFDQKLRYRDIFPLRGPSNESS